MTSKHLHQNEELKPILSSLADEGISLNEKGKLSMDLDMAHDEMESLRSIIRELREGLQTIYRDNGEDQKISAICNPLIERTRLI